MKKLLFFTFLASALGLKAQMIMRTLSSLEELANTSPYALAADPATKPLRATVLVQQYSTNNAAGWGASRWVFSAGYAGNTNGVVVTSNPAGAWLHAEDLVTPVMLGATIEEGDTADDTAAVQAAIYYNEAHDPPLPTYFPAGHYTISSITSVKSDLIGMPRVNRASRLKGVQFFHLAGATNSMIIIGDNQVQGIAQTATIENISHVGKSETNLRDPKTITAVTDRLTFEVDPGDVPTYSPSTRAPYYGWAGLFTDENRFVGAVMVKTVDTMTGVITVEPGTDNYATSDLSGELLNPGWKVCFPQETTVTNFQGIVYTGFSSAAGGYAAIEIRAAKGVNIRDCSFSRFYVGVAQYADNGPQFEGYNEFTYPRLASYLNAFAIYGSDTKVDGTIMVIGNYAPDIENADTPDAYTFDNEAFRSTQIGWHGIIGSTAANIEIGSAVYGLILENANGSSFGRVLIEGPIREAIWSLTGNSSFNAAGPWFLANVQVKTSPHFDVPTVVATNAPAMIRLDGNYSRGAIGNLSVYRHSSTGVSTNWSWPYLYDINPGTSNTLAFGTLTDYDSLITIEHPSGGQRAVNIHAGIQQFTAHDFTEPALTVARSGSSTFGLFLSSTLMLREDANLDGVFEYSILGFDGTSTTREARFGAQDGQAQDSVNDVIRASRYTGTNVAGNNLILVGQMGTGDGAPGNVVVQVADATTSGTTAQTPRTHSTFRGNMTFSLPSLAAPPTSSPATGSIYRDSTQDRLGYRTGTSIAGTQDHYIPIVNDTAPITRTLSLSAGTLTWTTNGIRRLYKDFVEIGTNTAVTVSLSAAADGFTGELLTYVDSATTAAVTVTGAKTLSGDAISLDGSVSTFHLLTWSVYSVNSTNVILVNSAPYAAP